MTTNRVADDDLRAQLDQLKQDMGSMRHDVAGIAKSMLNHGKASAVELGGKVSDQVNESMEQGRHVVREHPISATLTAFGVGILAGFLLSRR